MMVTAYGDGCGVARRADQWDRAWEHSDVAPEQGGLVHQRSAVGETPTVPRPAKGGSAIVIEPLNCVYVVATEPANPGARGSDAPNVTKIPDSNCDSFLRMALLAFSLCAPVLRGEAASGQPRALPDFRILWSRHAAVQSQFP